MNPEFNLKAALKAVAARRTDDDNDAQNALDTAGRGFIDPNSPQERINRSQQLETDIMRQIAYLSDEPESDVKTVRLGVAFDRLGELAAERGDYFQAALVSKTPERREHYRKILKAIDRPNDEICECPPDMIIDRANQVELQSNAVMTVDQILNKNGTLLNLQVCRKCGDLQAK